MWEIFPRSFEGIFYWSLKRELFVSNFRPGGGEEDNFPVEFSPEFRGTFPLRRTLCCKSQLIYYHWHARIYTDKQAWSKFRELFATTSLSFSLCAFRNDINKHHDYIHVTLMQYIRTDRDTEINSIKKISEQWNI